MRVCCVLLAKCPQQRRESNYGDRDLCDRVKRRFHIEVPKGSEGLVWINTSQFRRILVSGYLRLIQVSHVVSRIAFNRAIT